MKIAALILAIATAGPLCFSGEPEQPLNDVALRHAAILADEGHLKQAIMLNFKLLRNAPDQQIRDGARGQLQGLGLTNQEILKTDAASMKTDEFARLIEKIHAQARLRTKLDTDLQGAIQLARVSVVPYLAADDQIRVDVRQKDLVRALGLLLEIAFTENGGDAQISAMTILEVLNVTGDRVETVRKTVTEQKLPPEIEKEIVIASCIDQLRQRMESLGQETPAELDAETATRRKLQQSFGIKLYNYVKGNYSETNLVKKNPDLMEYWKGQTHVPVNQDF